jgi:Tol biopolymer transport system component
VTRPGRLHDYPIAFSPDGTRLLFLRGVAGHQSTNSPMNLFVVGVDGRGLARINPPGSVTGQLFPMPPAAWSPDGARVVFVAGPYAPNNMAVWVANADGTRPVAVAPAGGALFPSWSPDGKWIAFDLGPHHELFVVHSDGTGQRQVTSDPNGMFTWAGVWAPDSRHVLIQRGNGCEASGCDNLWIVPIDGSRAWPLTHRSQDYEAYAWLPGIGAAP